MLVIGATNRPQELDEAARRRMVRRVYIPLPETETRAALVNSLMKTQLHALTDSDMTELVASSHGYSGSDLAAVCKDAAMGPIRELGSLIASVDVSAVRPISINDFRKAITRVRASVSLEDLKIHEEWNRVYGMVE